MSALKVQGCVSGRCEVRWEKYSGKGGSLGDRNIKVTRGPGWVIPARASLKRGTESHLDMKPSGYSQGSNSPGSGEDGYIR